VRSTPQNDTAASKMVMHWPSHRSAIQRVYARIISTLSMSGPAKPAPPLSICGAFASLRVPTVGDLIFSTKAALAVILSLLIGVSQGLENPYWSALTVYVLMSQPQAGAIRSKAIFRLLGTILGGAAAIVLVSLCGSHIGMLLFTTILSILLACYAKSLDRTPFNYTWITMSLTIAVTVLPQVQAPETIFLIAATRVLEIGIAILMIGIVDSIVAPQAATPAFVHAISVWRDHAAEWLIASLAADASQEGASQRQRRLAFRVLVGLLGPLDAAGVQLPYDIVAVPPRARDLRFVRLTVAHLIARLAAANIWIEAWRVKSENSPSFEGAIADVRQWINERADISDKAIIAHGLEGVQLCKRLSTLENSFASSGDRAGLLAATTLRHLREVVNHWAILERTLHAIATGLALPRLLARLAKQATPVRSIDYVLGILDIAPLALALVVTAIIWYATAWTSGATAILIAFFTLVFILGTPGAERSARGITVWIATAFMITFFYQFVILPRVTSFPILIAVLTAAMLPLGVLMAMSLVGMLTIVMTFAFLSLQNAYVADFALSLEMLLGSMAGCLIGLGALHLCQFDRPRFSARRLAQALRRDVVNVADARYPIGNDRLLSLSVDRMALYFGIIGGLTDGDPLQSVDPVETLQIAVNLSALRQQERMLPPAISEHIDVLRVAFANGYAKLVEPDRPALLVKVVETYEAVLAVPMGDARLKALEALTGLRISMTTDGSILSKQKASAG
jgi:uncharacterized membrane protein YccC